MSKRKQSSNNCSQAKKRAIKGRKSLRGQPENQFGEIKQQASFSITPTAKERLEELRVLHGCTSRSELLEWIAHGLLKLSPSQSPNPSQEESSA